MGIWNKLFGKKETPAPPSAKLDETTLIHIVNENGVRMSIPKAQWRERILPKQLKQYWDEPRQLYLVILDALKDGFRSDILEAAEHLYSIDSSSVEATCIWGIALMEEKRFDEAEKIFLEHQAKCGEVGVVLTNLAKVYSYRDDDEPKVEKILWRSLEVDPNQENGMSWYCSIQRERFGEAGWQEALREIASLRGCWRAPLWLAQEQLNLNHLDRAMEYYRKVLAQVAPEVPEDVMIQISGDLGPRGFLNELLELIDPYFDPNSHGIGVGNNLIKANLAQGRKENARRIHQQLVSMKRPEWTEALNFWNSELLSN